MTLQNRIWSFAKNHIWAILSAVILICLRLCCFTAPQLSQVCVSQSSDGRKWCHHKAKVGTRYIDSFTAINIHTCKMGNETVGSKIDSSHVPKTSPSTVKRQIFIESAACVQCVMKTQPIKLSLSVVWAITRLQTCSVQIPHPDWPLSWCRGEIYALVKLCTGYKLIHISLIQYLAPAYPSTKFSTRSSQ